MHFIKKLIHISFLLVLSHLGYSQDEKPALTKPSTFSISAHFGYGVPFADMKNRFGNNSIAGGGLYWYNFKSGLKYGISLDYIFGPKVNEDVISNLRNENGILLGVNNDYANVLLRERGLLVDFTVTKTLKLTSKETNSGLAIGLGVGIMQSKVRIQVEGGNVPILAGDAIRGYDRNVVGPSLKQLIGYHYISNKSNANFSAFLEISEGFTKPTAPLNFNTMEFDDSRRLDVLVSLKIAYYLPLTKTTPLEEIYY